jgi:hypothetical protein
VKELTPDQFDAQLRERLEQFEMPYDSAAWARFETQLPPAAQPPTAGASWLKGAALAVVVTGAGLGLYQWTQESPAPVAQSTTTTVPVTQSEDAQTAAAGPLTHQPPATATQPAPTITTDRPVTAAVQSTPVIAAAKDSKAAEQRPAPAQTTTNDQRLSATPPRNEQPPMAEVNLGLKVSKTTICAGEEVSMLALTGTGGMRYVWNFSDGDQRTGTELSRTFAEAGQHEVVLTATKDGREWTRNETITVMPAPEANLAGMDDPLGSIPLYTLTTELETGETCTWRFDDNHTVKGAEAKHLFRKKANSTVELTVMNAHGCTTKAKRSIAALEEDFNLFAPSVITPNGDNLNETFIPAALLEMDCAFEMVVRDLKGKEVFRTSSAQMPWNGRDLTGDILPKGIYIWTVELKEAILTNRIFKGEITIR